MAPLPQNNTARVFIDYVTGDVATAAEHTVQLRVPSSVDTAFSVGQAAGLIVALGAGAFWSGWRVLRMRFQAANSTFSSPVVIPPALAVLVGTADRTFYTPPLEAVEATYQGRSPTTGRRVDISLYGLANGFAGLPSNFRLNLSGVSSGPLRAALDYLNDPDNEFLTVDKSRPTWYPYVNFNFNSYWESRIRRG